MIEGHKGACTTYMAAVARQATKALCRHGEVYAWWGHVCKSCAQRASRAGSGAELGGALRTLDRHNWREGQKVSMHAIHAILLWRLPVLLWRDAAQRGIWLVCCAAGTGDDEVSAAGSGAQLSTCALLPYDVWGEGERQYPEQ
jgi:hypothetical protein